jgi:hypothetical protein
MSVWQRTNFEGAGQLIVIDVWVGTRCTEEGLYRILNRSKQAIQGPELLLAMYALRYIIAGSTLHP